MNGYIVYGNLTNDFDRNIYRKKRVNYGNRYEYHWFAFDIDELIQNIKNKMVNEMVSFCGDYK